MPYTSIKDISQKISPYRKREEILDSWLVKRLDTILPKVMERSGIDTWIVACREYNEDPVLKVLVLFSIMKAIILTLIVFHI